MDAELRIKATADTADAKAGVEELKDAVTGLTRTETDRAAASVMASDSVLTDYAAQAKASGDVASALTEAKTKMGDFVAVAESGGKTATAAFTAARDATANLEVAIERARAAKAPIDPQAESSLTAYDAVLKKTQEELDKTAGSTGKTTKATAEFRALIPLASRELGPFGSALNNLSKSQNEVVAGFAKFLIPLAAVGGAIALAERAFAGLNDRGIQVPTVAGAAGAALDVLAIAMGGTSKATQEMSAAFQDAQKDTKDLEAATLSYKSGLDLLAALGGPTLNELTTAYTEAANAGIGFTGMEATQEEAVSDTTKELNKLNQAINAIRVVNPELAQQLGHDLVAAYRDLANGVDGARARLDEFKTTTMAATHETNAAASAIKEAYGGGKAGDEAIKGVGALAASVDALSQKLKAAKDAGMSDAQAYTTLKAEVTAVDAATAKYGAGLAIANQAAFSHAQAINNAGEAYTAFEQAIRDFENKAAAESITMQNLTEVIRVHSGSVADAKTAYFALKPAIDAQIASLEAILHTTGSLNATQAEHLGQLLKLREANEGENAALMAQNEIVLDQTRKIGDLGKKFEDLTKGYEKQRASIQNTADAQVAAAQKTSTAVAGQVDREINDLDRLRRDGTLSQSEFAAKVAELQEKKVDAWRDADSKTSTIQEDERSKLEELAKNYGEATVAIERELAKQKKTIGEAIKIHEDLSKQAKIASKDIVEEANHISDVARVSTGVFGSFDTTLKNLSAGGLTSVSGAIRECNAQTVILKGNLDLVVERLGKITISNAGRTGGAPDAGVGGTPGSEGE